MSEDTFAHHATAENNDFANWVRQIVGDKKLANDLERSLVRTKAAQAVESRLAFLASKLA